MNTIALPSSFERSAPQGLVSREVSLSAPVKKSFALGGGAAMRGAGTLVISGAAAGAVSLLAAKSIIAIGVGSQALPIVGTVIGIALMVFGAYLFYRIWQNERSASALSFKNPQIELQATSPKELTDAPPLQGEATPDKRLIEIISPTKPELQKEIEQDPLAITNSEKLLTASNVIQWGLIGAAYGGIAPTIIMPLAALSSLGSEIASFCMLPKDASWLRKAMSIPLLSKAIISYNPWVAKLFQVTSLYNVVQSSAAKLKNAWNAFSSNRRGALTSAGVNLFNLASSVAFASGIVKIPPPKPKCPPRAIVNLPCYGCGMFSVQHYLVGVFDQVEKGHYSGMKVNFGHVGPYIDPARGPNWFDYYFKPIDIADETCPYAPEKTFTIEEYGNLCNYAENVYGHENRGLSPDRAAALLQKYLILKPEIQGEIEQFAKTHFSDSDYVVGVHYRGTDKACNSHHCEARRVTYEEMTSSIKDHLTTAKVEDLSKVKIFAASDEAKFVEHLEAQFPGQVVASPAQRSTDGKPLHLNARNNPYQMGKEALIDASLLAKVSNVLIRTSSNLSKIAGLLVRKGAQVIEVSKRYYQDPVR